MSYRHNKGLLFVFNLIYYIKYKYFEKVGIYMEDIQQMINNIKPLFEKTMKEAKQFNKAYWQFRKIREISNYDFWHYRKYTK